MKTVCVIAWRDAKQIIRAPMYYLIAAFCTIIWFIVYRSSLTGFVMNSRQAQFGQAAEMNVHTTVFLQHVSVTNLIFIFAIPLLMMRAIAEEKKTRTFDLLLTSPIHAWQISVGKFVGGAIAVLGLLAISALYPASIALLTKISWSTLFANYLGLLLLSLVYVAVGLFASSLTDSAMLSGFIGFVLCLLFFLVGQMVVDTDLEWLTAVKDYVSAGQQLYPFMLGNIRTSSIIYFLTAIGFFVFLSERVVESSRWR
jgi:ABC-2 type transport system permease protein